MNILFWILQAALALLCIPGGAFKIAKFEELKKGVNAMRLMPKGLWFFFGAFEVLAGLCLLIPDTTAIAALLVVVESVLVSALYTKYKDHSPRMFTIAMAIIAAIIFYGRSALNPF